MVEINERANFYQHVLQEFVTHSEKVQRKFYEWLSDDNGESNSYCMYSDDSRPRYKSIHIHRLIYFNTNELAHWLSWGNFYTLLLGSFLRGRHNKVLLL